MTCFPKTFKQLNTQETQKNLNKQFMFLKWKKFLTKGTSCELCGGTHELSLHHKFQLQWEHTDPNFDHNTQDNLTTLCKYCHDTWHHYYEKKELCTYEEYTQLPLKEKLYNMLDLKWQLMDEMYTKLQEWYDLFEKETDPTQKSFYEFKLGCCEKELQKKQNNYLFFKEWYELQFGE